MFASYQKSLYGILSTIFIKVCLLNSFNQLFSATFLITAMKHVNDSSSRSDIMATTAISLILAPYHTGIPLIRVGKGPNAILSHNLIPRLETMGLLVTTHTIPSVDDYEGEIGRSFEVIRRISRAVSKAVDKGSFPVVLAGNCNASVGMYAGLHIMRPIDIVWFDAHSDFDTPDECLSGYFDGSGVAMLAGRCWKSLLNSVPGYSAIDMKRVTYCGVRDLSDSQKQVLEGSGAKIVYGWMGEDVVQNGVRFDTQLKSSFDAHDDSPALVHFDLDCLDTSIGLANEYAAPGGLDAQVLLSCFDVIAAERQVAGLTVASFNPLLKGGDAIANLAVDAIVRLVHQLITKHSADSLSVPGKPME
jgi:arginase